MPSSLPVPPRDANLPPRRELERRRLPLRFAPMKPKGTAASRTTGGRTTGGGPRSAHKIRWGDDNTPVSSDDARGRIVAAALDCVRRFGVDKTGMDDVAKAANITRPTVYKYFPTRNQLVMAVFIRALDERLEQGLADFFRDA